MRRGLRILILASFAYTVASSMLSPIFAVYVQNIGGGVLEISSVWSAQTLTIGLLVFVLAKIEDKLDKRKILVLGYFMYTVGFFSYLFVQNIPQVFVVQIYLGIAAALSIPAFDAFYSQSLDRGKESSQWGVWESGTRIIGAGAAVAGGFIVAQYSFGLLFILMTAVSFISGIMMMKLLKRRDFSKIISSI